MMTKHDKGLATTTRLVGGSDPVQQGIKVGILGSVLLPLAPFIVLARFGGFDLSRPVTFLLDFTILLTAALPILAFANTFVRYPSKARFFKDWAGAASFLGTFVIACLFAFVRSGFLGAESVAAIGILFLALHRGALLLLRSKKFQGRPALALGSSFALMIIIGSIFLGAAPNATVQGENLGIVDALFTATSATCVTGLETVSTASTLSIFGQSIVLFLIQIGGLGIMTLGTFLLLTSGHRLGLSSRAMVRDSLNVEGQNGMARLLAAILGFTFAFEFIGALCFYFWFGGDDHPIFTSIFHSVSAFCNAGFALRSDSFSSFAVDPLFNLTGIALITTGGIGFTVLRELRSRLFTRIRGERSKPLSLHTRIVLITSLVLTVVGAVGFFLLEFNGVLSDLSTGQSVLVSVFQSVSTRTAGFATVSFGGEEGLSQATRFFLMPLMWVGASPGSTGGGLKTVTLAVLILGVVAQMRRRKHAEILGRQLPDDQMKQAATIAFLYGATLCVAVLALLISDGTRFELNELLFEAVSAVATVGFSCGVSGSDQLSDFGKLTIIVLMFVGRLGPLTLVLVLGRNRGHVAIDYPEERVMIG
ncbi:MAG: trk system potassium uptake protein TrkH [Planctomycetota bacterium]|jgi:trk system potassium uptake protein TrkH